MSGPWISLLNFSFTLCGLMVGLLGLMLTLSTTYMERWDRRFFIIIFALLLAYLGANLVGQISDISGTAELSKVSLFFESFLSSLLMPVLPVYMLRCLDEDMNRSPLLLITAFLELAYLVLLIVAQFTELIYYFTADNVYHRGPLYPLLLLPAVLLMAVSIIGLLRRWGSLKPKQRIAFLLYALIPGVAMLVQMLTYGLYLIVIGSTLAAVSMFLFILLEQTESAIRQREENARQRASIMVLQMRPHFIYNTMTSIYYLCGEDPERAQQVILDFTSYLRKNFTAIAREETIPFQEELEHTRAYLAVEQVRFSGRLFVDFDTPYTHFRLPPLTLQPIVENAVKHGVDPELEPLTITVRNREVPGGSAIFVEDNGPGFSPADDAEPHIGLANIRERLELMCGGSLTIRTRDEGGTVVTLFIPDKASQEGGRRP